MLKLNSNNSIKFQLARASLVWVTPWVMPGMIPAAFGGGAADTSTQPETTKSWALEELMPPQDPWAQADAANGTWSATQDIFARVTRAQNGKNTALVGFHDRQGRLSLDDQKLRLITLRGVQQTTFQEQKTMNRYMVNQLGLAISDHVRERSELLQMISRGLTFDTRTGISMPSATSATGTAVRYGLVLKEVEPSGNGVHVAALTMDDQYMHQILSEDTQAKVNWTIGPLAEDSEAKLFESALQPDGSASDISLFGFKPDLSLRGKVEPNFQGNAQNLAGLKVKLEQPQGLYRMEMLTGGPASQMAQEVAVPVYGSLRLTRLMDGNFNVSRTSVINVLGFSDSLRLIPVNVHYAHADSSVRAESSFNAWEGRIGVESNIAGPTGSGHGPLCTVSYTRAL